MAKASVKGRLSQEGSRNSSIKRDHTSGSEIFQIPLEIKMTAIANPAA
jgi:hypothetical protein